MVNPPANLAAITTPMSVKHYAEARGFYVELVASDFAGDRSRLRMLCRRRLSESRMQRNRRAVLIECRARVMA